MSRRRRQYTDFWIRFEAALRAIYDTSWRRKGEALLKVYPGELRLIDNAALADDVLCLVEDLVSRAMRNKVAELRAKADEIERAARVFEGKAAGPPLRRQDREADRMERCSRHVRARGAREHAAGGRIMVGGFPKRPAAPAPKPAESVAPEDVEFDEEGRRRITVPIVPAATRPPPTTYARPLPPMPGAPKPGALPRPPARPPARPVMPTVKREGPLLPPKVAAPAPAAAKRPPPPTPYVRRPPATRLDPNDVPLGSYGDNWGK